MVSSRNSGRRQARTSIIKEKRYYNAEDKIDLQNANVQEEKAINNESYYIKSVDFHTLRAWKDVNT